MKTSSSKQGLSGFSPDTAELRTLILGMRKAYALGENVMEYARANSGSDVNTEVGILIAYDLQAGSYIAGARKYPERNARRCQQMADILGPLLAAEGSVMEVGCGEATTLAGVLQRLSQKISNALGFDIS